MTDPYEDWKAQGRPGGNFAAWQAGQGAPVPAAPAAPTTPASPPSTSGLSSSAANKALQNAGGPGSVGLPANASQAQIDAWFNEAVNAGGYTENGDNTSQTAYNLSGFSGQGSADATGMRAYAKTHGLSEDYDRWSESQLKTWDKQKSSNCPPNAPYMAYDGSGCVEKPIDSTRGPGQDGGGAGKAGAGGAGIPTDPSNYNPDDPLQARLMELMQSGGGSFGGINAGSFTKGGGAMWSTPTPGSETPAAAATPAPTTPAPTTPSTGPGSAALMSATLNAFGSNPPSSQMSGGVGQPTPTVGSPTPTPAPAPLPAPVAAAVQPKTAIPAALPDPNAWWKSGVAGKMA